jgi:hypothetical protein
MDALIPDTWQVIEKVTVFTTLGIRFWDPAKDTQVRDGLVVTARPEKAAGPIIEAFQTASGIYAFQGLPGLQGVEYPEGRSATGTNTSPTRRYLIGVDDRQGRFSPVLFYVDLPLSYRGIFLGNLSAASPPQVSPRGFYLFSAPSRSVCPGQAAIRGTLKVFPGGKPAGYAVLEVEVNRNKKWYGIADERGCVAILFPYPPIKNSHGISPPGGAEVPLDQEQWQLDIRVRYEPAVLKFPQGMKQPDLHSILNQSAGSIWPDRPGSLPSHSAVPTWSTALRYGREFILRTGGLTDTELWIEAGV